jgi:GxxExxY protein
MESQNVKSRIEKVKAIAKDVYRSLGSGFSEDVYDKAMQVGLRLAGINYESQKVIELKYKDHHVGEGYPDLVVRLGRERLIIELKAVGSEMGSAEEQQLRNYMKILNINHGLLINFQQPGRRKSKTTLEFKEVWL